MAKVVRTYTGLPDADPFIGDARLFDLLAGRLREQPGSFLYLVPTRRMERAFEYRMLERGLDCFIGGHSRALNDFALDCLRSLRPGLRLLGETERVLLLSRLLSEPDLHDLGEGAGGFPGMVSAVGAEIMRLKHSLVKCRPWPLKHGKAAALGKVYRRYEEELDRLNSLDEPAVFQKLADIPAETISAGPMSGRQLLVLHGFYDLTPAQLQFVRRLSDCCEELWLIADHEEGRERIFSPVKQIIEAFERAVIERGWPNAPPPLLHAARRIFAASSSPPKTVNADGRVRFITAAGRAEEIEAVAADIKRAALAGEVALRRVCVALPDARKYAALVREIFPRMGIQFNSSYGFDLDRSPVVSAVFKMIEVVQSDYQRERVVELFRAPFISCDGAAPGVLDSVARAAHVIGGREDWSSKLAERARALTMEAQETWGGRYAADNPDRRAQELERDAALTEQVARAVDAALRELSSLNEERSLAEHCRILRELMTRFGVSERIVPPGESALPPIEVEKQFRALSRFEEVLDEIARTRAELYPEVRGARLYTLADFLTILRNVVAAGQYQVQTFRDAGVQVMEIRGEMRGMEFDRVYAVGMLNGEFPCPPSATIFLTEAEARSLGLPGRDRHEAEERYHFLRLLCSARECLTLSWPLSEGGDPTTCSPFLDEVTSSLSMPAAAETRPCEPLACSLYSVDRVSRWLGEKLSSPPDDDAPAVSQVVLRESHLAPLARRIRRSLAAEAERAGEGRFSGFIRDERLLRAISLAFGEQWPFSVHQLEMYGLCPFRFFCAQALHLAELDEPDEEVTPLTKGGALHEILRRFYADRQGARPTAAEHAEALKSLVALTEEEFGRLPFRDLFWRKELERAKKLADRFLEEEQKESRFEPKYVEFAFGGDPRMAETDPFDKLRAGPESAKQRLELAPTIHVVGKIDRIETSGEDAIVVDYKTGRGNTPTKGQMERGVSYQLPIYMLAVEKLLKLRPVGAAYYRVNDATHFEKKCVLPGKNTDLPVFLKQMQDKAVAAVNKIRGGRFPVTDVADRRTGCAHCDFERVCRARREEDDDESAETD